MARRAEETVPLRYLRTLLRVASEQGYDARGLVEQLDLPRELLSERANLDKAVAASHYNTLYTCIMNLLQDESLGVSPAGHYPAGTFRMMCLYLIHCPDLESALLRADEFQAFCRHLAGLPRLETRPLVYLPGGRVMYRLPGVDDFTHRDSGLGWYAIAHTLAVWRRFCSWLIGKQIELDAVHIALPEPAETSPYPHIFECPISFGEPYNGFVFDAHYLQAPVIHDEEALRQFLRNAPYHLLANTEVDSDDGIVAQMRRIVGPDLSRDFPSVVEMASRLHMSVRTLRRRLKEQGTTYQEFKDRTRRDAATQLLSRPELKINAVAALLGFDEPSAFHRSFKKWTGNTPGEYRAGLTH